MMPVVEVIGLPFAKTLAWIKALARVVIPGAIVFGILFWSICGWALIGSCGPKTVAVVGQAVSCEQDAIAKDLVPVVAAILSDVSNWKADLEALASSFGVDTINCAVQAVETVIKAQHTASLDTIAITRGESWLKEHAQ